MNGSRVPMVFRWVTFALAGTSLAQPPAAERGRPPPPPPWEVRLSAQGAGPAAPRDGAGRLSTLDTGIGLARIEALGRGFVRLGGSYDRAFLTTSDAGEAGPWRGMAGEYERLSVSALHVRPGRWTWTALGAVEASHRAGLSANEGLSALALVAGQRRLAGGLSVGAGLLASLRLDEDPLVIPIPVFEYRWGREWTLAVERGLSLRHRPEGGADEYFAEAGFEFHRYRLPDDEAAAPGGVLAHRQVTGQIGWERRVSSRVTFRGFLGAAVWQELVLKDGDARTLRRVRAEPSPSAGLMVRYAF